MTDQLADIFTKIYGLTYSLFFFFFVTLTADIFTKKMVDVFFRQFYLSWTFGICMLQFEVGINTY